MMLVRSKNRIDKTNKSLWYCLETDFQNLDGDEFEKLIALLYQRRGFHVIKSLKGTDQGVDVMIRKGKTTILIQAKNWKGKVGNKVILETAGSQNMFNATYALVITSSEFTKSALEVINSTPRIRGMTGEELKRQIRLHFKREIIKPKDPKIGNKILEIFRKQKPIPTPLTTKIPEGKITPNPRNSRKPTRNYQKKRSRVSHRHKSKRTFRHG